MKTVSWLPHVLSATAVTATVALCLVSCSQDPEHHESVGVEASESASPDSSLHPGTFQATLPGGASVRITLPATGVPDQRVESLRHDARVSRATYATVEIDNRKGASPISVSRLVLKAQDGGSYQLEHVSRAVEKWMPRLRDGKYRAHDGSQLSEDAAKNLKIRLRDAGEDATGDVAVGRRDSNILVGDISGVPQNFVSLELVPKIGDREVLPVQAHPEGRGGSSGASGEGDATRGDTGSEDLPDPDATAGAVDPADPADPGPTPEPSADNPGVDPGDPVVPVDPGPVVPDPDPVPTAPVVPGPGPTDPVGPVDPGVVDPGVPGPTTVPPVVTEPTLPAPAVTDAQSGAPVDPSPQVPVVDDPGTIEIDAQTARPSAPATENAPAPETQTVTQVSAVVDTVPASAETAPAEQPADSAGPSLPLKGSEPTTTPGTSGSSGSGSADPSDTTLPAVEPAAGRGDHLASVPRREPPTSR